MSVSINKIILSLFLSIFFISCFNAQELKIEDKPAVKLVARSLKDKVLLRWAVNTPMAWKKANAYGFVIERITIERDGIALKDEPNVLLTSEPLKPAPLEAWESLATKNQNAAILAQALYGESFNATPPGNSTMAMIYAVNDELEQRHTFALLAAEQSWDAAKLAGWAFEDSSIKSNEKYLYAVKVFPFDDYAINIDKSAVIAGVPFFEPLPEPVGLAAVFKDNSVDLSWDFEVLKRIYTSYSIERSENGGKFKQLNTSPIFSAQQAVNSRNTSLFYQDSISNGIKYSYRIKGYTPFGEIGPSSGTIEGIGKEQLDYYPRINKKRILDESAVEISWSYDVKGNDQLKGFYLSRSDSNDGKYEKVIEDISPFERKINYSGIRPINYFKVVAVGKNGVESESLSTMVQPIDSTPPSPPVNINAFVDSTGLVTLNWEKNSEIDVAGYRVYRNTDKNDEFTMVGNDLIKNNFYVDTIEVSSLNKNIYYKLIAEDFRYNTSKFSKIYKVELPDFVPPSAPIIQNFKNTKEGLALSWVPSSSPDVKEHMVFRKAINNKKWKGIYTTSTATNFTDEENLQGTYAYTVVSIDSVGLESVPAKPILVKRVNNSVQNQISKLTAIPNRELRFIVIQWKVKTNKIFAEFRLYKGINDQPLNLYRTLNPEIKVINDTDVKVNTRYRYAIQGVGLNGELTPFYNVKIIY